jgi:hypothetical protein
MPSRLKKDNDNKDKPVKSILHIHSMKTRSRSRSHKIKKLTFLPLSQTDQTILAQTRSELRARNYYSTEKMRAQERMEQLIRRKGKMGYYAIRFCEKIASGLEFCIKTPEQSDSTTKSNSMNCSVQ